MLNILKKNKLNDEILQELEDELILSDLGIKLSKEIIEKLKNNKFNQELSKEELKDYLVDIIGKKISPYIKQDILSCNQETPFVILVCGTNGSGKTSSIGKIAYMFKNQNKTIMLAPCDTFRAGAYEQLKIWANKQQVMFFADESTKDPAAIAYKAIEEAKKQQIDILIIDTAGRQPNNKNLMEELKKIYNTVKKINPEYPHLNLLVVDGTLGQSAFHQAQQFKEAINIDSFLVTKLDSGAKGGTLVNICYNLHISPIFISHGEKEDSLEVFDLYDYLFKMLNIDYA